MHTYVCMYIYHYTKRFGELGTVGNPFGSPGIQVLMAQKLPSAVVQRFNECRGCGGWRERTSGLVYKTETQQHSLRDIYEPPSSPNNPFLGPYFLGF